MGLGFDEFGPMQSKKGSQRTDSLTWSTTVSPRSNGSFQYSVLAEKDGCIGYRDPKITNETTGSGDQRDPSSTAPQAT
jgi:hypothetical protein